MFGFIMLPAVSLTVAAPRKRSHGTAVRDRCQCSTGFGTSICTAGSGNHRVKLTCGLGSAAATYLRYGTWIGIPNPSAVYCATGDRATGATY
jgi:hypothetical protein